LIRAIYKKDDGLLTIDA